MDFTLFSLSAPPRACTFFAIISSTLCANRHGASATKAIIDIHTLRIINNLLGFLGLPSLKSAIVPLGSPARGDVHGFYVRSHRMFLSDYVFGEEFLLAQVQEEDYAKMGGEERLGIRD